MIRITQGILLLLMPVLAQASTWYTESKVDEMSGTSIHYAFSPSTSTTRTLNFPYDDLKSWVYVGCAKGYHWITFGFSHAPNLTNDKTRDGFNLIDSRVKFDNDIKYTSFKQNWGDKFLKVELFKEPMMKGLRNSSELLLELEWYGLGAIYFKYDLDNANVAISDVLDKCAARNYISKPKVSLSETESQISSVEIGFDNNPYTLYQASSADLESGWYVILADNMSEKSALDLHQINHKRYSNAKVIKSGDSKYAVIIGPYIAFKAIKHVRKSLRNHYNDLFSDLDVIEVN